MLAGGRLEELVVLGKLRTESGEFTVLLAAERMEAGFPIGEAAVAVGYLSGEASLGVGDLGAESGEFVILLAGERVEAGFPIGETAVAVG